MSLINALTAQTKADYLENKPSAENDLRQIFDSDIWNFDFLVNEYTLNNKNNLWNNELRKPIKHAIESVPNGEQNYFNWLKEIHFINVTVYNKNVFSKYKSNVGWRLSILSLPVARVIAIGVASHYQGGQKHNQLGFASNLLYDAITTGLQDKDFQGVIFGRKVNADDWDRDGLILNPIKNILGIDLISLPNVENIILKDIRTTTVKKVIASFICIEPIDFNLSNSDFDSKLKHLESVGRFLASSVYPFRSTEEFEPVRSLALQDLAAASLRLQLHRKSSTRSIVRIYYGPPGTGKTLTAVREAVKLADGLFDDKGDPEQSFTKFNELRDQLAFVTFHQALQYEDLFESIRPSIESEIEEIYSDNTDEDVEALEDEKERNNTGQLTYRIHEGLFLKIIRRASQHPENDYAIVIDEINRADLSRIFGPLISALEPDKRVGAEFPIGVELQYPKAQELESRLYLPANIHFLGTMNSADRNIALVDHALRRRFDFIAVPPESSLLGNTSDEDSINMRFLLDTVNERIEHLLNADLCIGHGYFMPCKTNLDVVSVFARKILPLLTEYFYGNSGLMLLVLGDTIKGDFNIYQIIEPETSFEKIFNARREDAAILGYRANEIAIDFRLDPRFWNPFRAIPGPNDASYATKAIKKIYESLPHTSKSEE